jgi:hypothetical protein
MAPPTRRPGARDHSRSLHFRDRSGHSEVRLGPPPSATCCHRIRARPLVALRTMKIPRAVVMVMTAGLVVAPGGCFYQLGFSCSHCCVHQSERASRDGCDARKMHLRREQRHCYRHSEGRKFDSDGRTRIVCDRVLRSCRPDIHRGDSWPSTGSAAALDSQRLHTGDNKVVSHRGQRRTAALSCVTSGACGNSSAWSGSCPDM